MPGRELSDPTVEPEGLEMRLLDPWLDAGDKISAASEVGEGSIFLIRG